MPGPAAAPGRRGPLRSRSAFTGESAQAHRRRAFEVLETGLRAPTEEQPDVEVRRRIVEGWGRTVLPDASAEAALLVVGARRPHGRVASRIGRVTHAVLHLRPAPWRSSPNGPDSGPGRSAPRTTPDSPCEGAARRRILEEPESREEAGIRREETAVVREETPCITTRSAP
ncbi:hypothetical protein ACFYN9_36620 [Streptomyces collinus]|uniref:hypothetical protein n=1 Tax=Streptomyces collinus TaxID=42684 RepID=UPI00367842CA